MDFSSLGLGELDWVFVVIILLSTLLGASRGMVREIFALVGWVAAFFVSLYCSADLAAVLPFQAHMGLMTRTFVSIVLIVIGCVFLAGLVGKILRSILASVSIGAEDRLFGLFIRLSARIAYRRSVGVSRRNDRVLSQAALVERFCACAGI